MNREDRAPSSAIGRWFVVQVRHRWELRVKAGLMAKGFEVLVPLLLDAENTAVYHGNAATPIFPGYVFFKFDQSQDGNIVTTPGVKRILSFGGRWAELNSVEMNSVRAVSKSPLPRRAHPYPTAGTWVRVAAGPLKGVEGRVIDVSRRVVLGVTLLQRAMTVTFDSDTVLIPIDLSARDGIHGNDNTVRSDCKPEV